MNQSYIIPSNHKSAYGMRPWQTRMFAYGMLPGQTRMRSYGMRPGHTRMCAYGSHTYARALLLTGGCVPHRQDDHW